jgi:uncharacterized protein YbaR (Trm112 family)
MREDYPLAKYGCHEIEAEEPFECPKCAILFDLRFWGQGEIRWMDRKEAHTYEPVLVCPDCRTLYPMGEILGANE